MLAKVTNYQMIKYNIVVCCYGNRLVNVAAYVIPKQETRRSNLI